MVGYRDGVLKADSRLRTAVFVLLAFAMALIAGCGSSGSSNRSATTTTLAAPPPIARQVVARVGSDVITKAILNESVRANVDEVFFEVSSHKAPAGLIAEPADYPRCTSTLTKITPFPGQVSRQPKATPALIQTLCQEIHQRFLESALSELISNYAILTFAAAHGVPIPSRAETQRALQHIEPELTHRETFQQYLANRGRTLSQELFNVRNDLIVSKLLHQPKLFKEISLTPPTAHCEPGYIVKNCQGYTPPTTPPTPVGSVLLEEIARWRPQTSHGFTGIPAE